MSIRTTDENNVFAVSERMNRGMVDGLGQVLGRVHRNEPLRVGVGTVPPLAGCVDTVAENAGIGQIPEHVDAVV